MLVVDYPPEECEAFAARLKAAGLDLDLPARADLAPSERMEQVGRIATGYVYYVSLKGVTGAGHLDTAAVAEMVPRIRAPRQACRWAWASASATPPPRGPWREVADAVVIGSRLVQILEAETRDNAARGRARLHGRDPRRAGRLNRSEQDPR